MRSRSDSTDGPAREGVPPCTIPRASLLAVLLPNDNDARCGRRDSGPPSRES